MLRLLSIGDDASIRTAVARADQMEIAIDDRTAALVRLASLIVSDSALPSYQRAVQAALDSGATVDEILSLLLVLAEPSGSSVVIAAAPKLATALGYDVDAGLEDLST